MRGWPICYIIYMMFTSFAGRGWKGHMRAAPLLALLAALLALPAGGAGAAAPLAVVAAENFYGDVAQQIGGPDVAVTSILSNPDQDPHLFEASSSVMRAISSARIVIYNGVDYDAWVEKLLGVTHDIRRGVIVVAQLVGRKPGDNPHIWYDPATMPALAAALADELGRADPAHRAEYRQRLAQFQHSLEPITAKIAALRQRLAGTEATATEPVFGYMLGALGMTVRDARFQLAVMNNTEPSASDVAAFENDLRTRRARLLVYNSQASDRVAERMVGIAKAAHIPVVAVSETEPPGTTYQAWILSELDAIDRALAK
jgi:zinc/manganese transport system substrate-binding protein